MGSIDSLLDLPQTDRGRSALVTMAGFLTERTSFPDLERREDAAAKRKEARNAVSQWQARHSKQQEAMQSGKDRVAARKRFGEQQRQATQSRQTLQRLAETLDALARSLGTQRAGYGFPAWFHELLDLSEIPSRKPCVRKGREIDRSLTVSGTTCLVELKFTAKQAGGPDIDTFLGKITAKAGSAMGVRVSMSGNSSVAKPEASRDRTPVWLLDHSHLHRVPGGITGLDDVVNRIRRRAAQTEEPCLAVEDFGG